MNVKLKYVRPCVEFIDFSLTSSIAGPCIAKALPTDLMSCGVEENGWVIYEGGNGVCTIDSFASHEFCYHVPAEDRSIHAS